MGGLKFSGNAQRRKKKFVLFHGTFLLDFDIAGIGEFLTIPHRQPDYRANRTHQDFLVNLGVPDSAVSAALSAAWQASGDLSFSLEKKMEELIESRYSKEEWNFKF